ncbi:MAG TPA: hypothetical protein PKC93_16465 [Candidatus Obscuribacter sp.]|nr:hypothetical protein [Candidatus Obscuribacter sp.]
MALGSKELRGVWMLGQRSENRVHSFLAAGLIALSASLALPLSALAEPGLSYDHEHDVLVLPGCDLAVRYNNKTFVPVRAKLLGDSYINFLKIRPEKAVKIYEDYESAGMKTAPEQILLESYDAAKVGTFSFSRFNKAFLDTARVREVQFTNERVAKETGLTPGAFHGIASLKSFEVVPKSGETPYYLFVMVSPPHLNIFVRKMRATSRTFDFDPAVIVAQLRVVNTQDSQPNVELCADPSKPDPKDGQNEAPKEIQPQAESSSKMESKKETTKETASEAALGKTKTVDKAAPAGRSGLKGNKAQANTRANKTQAAN